MTVLIILCNAFAPFKLPPESINTTPLAVTTKPKVALLPKFSLVRLVNGPTIDQTFFVTFLIDKVCFSADHAKA